MIYIIGFKYDDFESEGFHIVSIASTIENAKVIKHYYEEENEDREYEIQEWELDALEPAREIVECSFQSNTTKLKSYKTMPYKIIE